MRWALLSLGCAFLSTATGCRSPDELAGKAGATATRGEAVMHFVPSGTTTMGLAEPAEKRHHEDADALPAHSVRVSSFWMDETEVTNAQYARFILATGHAVPAPPAKVWRLGFALAEGELERPTVIKVRAVVGGNRSVEKEFEFAPGTTAADLAGYYANELRNSGVAIDYTVGSPALTLTGAEKVVCAPPVKGLAVEVRPAFTWTGGTPPEGEEDHPVVWVSWSDAVAYASWVTAQRDDGFAYRLPTEAEWEFACRTGGPGGGTSESDFTLPVSEEQGNGLGIRGLAGNVAEWCSDWYGPTYYWASPSQDPSGPSEGEDRVVRGGSWKEGLDWPEYCFRREFAAPEARHFNHIGFRLVRVPMHIR